MYTTDNKYWAKSIVGLSLSVALLSGAILIPANPAIAASSTVSKVFASTVGTANQIIAAGKSFIGVTYKYGAKSGTTSLFDCSSLMQYIFGENGIDLPRSSKDQSKVGSYVPRNKLQPGDLVFFYSPIHHVAVYMGDGKILHTYGDPGVTTSTLESGWWDRNYNTARRVLPEMGQDLPKPTPKPTTKPTPKPTTKPTPKPKPIERPDYDNKYPWHSNFPNWF